MARSAKNSAWNEVFAIILLLTGTLLFFALISYSPRDLPSWVPWSYLSPPNRPAQNFIGPFGAIFASVFYLLIGAASYFLAAVLLGFGAAKLFYPRLRVIARLPWIVLFIVSGACLLQLQRRYFFDWKKLNIQGPAGSNRQDGALLRALLRGVGQHDAALRHLLAGCRPDHQPIAQRLELRGCRDRGRHVCVLPPT